MRNIALGALLGLVGLLTSRQASAQVCSPGCSVGYFCQAGTCLPLPAPPSAPTPDAAPTNAPPAPPPPGSAVPGEAPAPAAPPPPAYPPPGYPQPTYPPGYPPPPGYPTAYPPGYGPPPGYPAYVAPTGYAPPPPPSPPPAPRVPAGYHLHDGFYLQLALGAVLFSGSTELPSETKNFSTVGGGGQFLMGGTVAPGLVVGGGMIGGDVEASEVIPAILYGDGSDVINIQTGRTMSLNVLSGFVDYYFDPRKGMHAQASFGYAQLQNPNITTPFSGLGLGVAFGNQWWISDNWGFGLLGRVQYVSLKQEDSDTKSISTGDRATFRAFLPALLLSLTYH